MPPSPPPSAATVPGLFRSSATYGLKSGSLETNSGSPLGTMSWTAGVAASFDLGFALRFDVFLAARLATFLEDALAFFGATAFLGALAARLAFAVVNAFTTGFLAFFARLDCLRFPPAAIAYPRLNEGET